MGFYNVQQGDAPVFDYLARHFSMSDNYHQAVMGGTGTNHVALGTGTGASYQDANGDPQNTARRPDREPQRPAGDEQLLHPGRLLRRDLLQVRRPEPARRRGGARLPAPAVAGCGVGVRS